MTMQQASAQAKKAAADGERSMFAARTTAASPADIARVRKRLEAVVGRLDGLGALIKVSLLGSEAFLIDARGDRARILDIGATAPADMAIDLSPRHFHQLLDDELEPRTAIQYGYMLAEGDPLLAIRLGDALTGSSDDRSPFPAHELPRPTTDLDRAIDQFEKYGYCIVKDVLSPPEVAAARARLVEQAEVERARGIAMLDGGEGLPNQRPWALITKGREFVDLLDKPIVQRFGEHFLGEGFILGSMSANIAGPGGEPQTLHYDQMVHQPSVPFMTGLNIAWFLDEVTEANGGTRIIPGSHHWRRGPDNPYSIEGTIAAEGPAGSVLIWDTRLWHGTGPNRTNAKRHVILSIFYRYYFRSNENYSLMVGSELEAELSDAAKTLLGFRVTGRLGTTEDVREGALVTRPAKPVGPLYYSDLP